MNKEVLHILVVDDSEDDTLLLERALKQGVWDIHIERIDNQEAMRQALSNAHWDVVISDFKIPGFGGMEALRLFNSFHLNIPFILTSGKISEEIAVEALREGAQDFVSKQNFSRLLPAIARGIERVHILNEKNNALEALNRGLVNAVEAIANTIEMRDPYTAGHQNRVALLAKAIATKMGLDAHRIEGLVLAAKIHDVGKIQIPAEILNKPTKLTNIEFMLIQTHPETGYEIIKDIEFPWPVATMVRQHHEKLDGSGYPLGLKGDDILLESRILTVADIVEAMASHRPYRPSLGIEAALAELIQERGTKLDATVVDACVSLFKEDNYQLLA